MQRLREKLGLPKKKMSMEAFAQRLRQDGVEPIIIELTMMVVDRVIEEHKEDYVGEKSMKALRSFRFHHHLSEEECYNWYINHQYAFDMTFERLNRYSEIDLEESEHIEHWRVESRLVEVVLVSMIAVVVFDSWVYGTNKDW